MVSWRDTLPPLAFVALLGALWDYGTGSGVIPRYLLPGPAALGHELVANRAVLTRHAVYTIKEAVGGFALGNGVAVAAAFLFSWSPVLRAAFYPIALASRAVPIIAITPLLVILLGRGLPPIVAVVAISVYFPTLLNMVRGLQSADTAYHELLHTLSASKLQRLRMIEVPASLPYLFAALKVGASVAFISAIVGEWIGANQGLGYLIVLSGSYFKIPTLWAAVVVAAALTLALVGLVTLGERLLSIGPPPAELS